MAKLSKEIVIVAAKRTPFGTLQGALKGITATDLAVHAAKAALAQSGVAAADTTTRQTPNRAAANHRTCECTAMLKPPVRGVVPRERTAARGPSAALQRTDAQTH